MGNIENIFKILKIPLAIIILLIVVTWFSLLTAEAGIYIFTRRPELMLEMRWLGNYSFFQNSSEYMNILIYIWVAWLITLLSRWLAHKIKLEG